MYSGLMYHVEAYAQAPPDVVFSDVIAGALLAEELGFDEIWFAEHHFGYHKSDMPAPLIFATHIAAITGRIRVGTAIVVLPIHHPIAIAEQAAVLDVLSGGRLSIGFGSGTSQLEFDAYGVDRDQRHARFREALEILLLAWSGEPFTYQGQFHSIIDPIAVRPRPIQSVDRLAWVGASSAPSAQVAGELGMGIMLPRGRTLEHYVEISTAYQSSRQAFGHPPGRVSIARNVFVAATREEALKVGVPAMRAFCRRWHPGDPISEASPAELFEKLKFIIGTPDYCFEKLDELRRVTGASHVSIQPSWDELPQDAVIRSIEMIGREVLPRLRAEETASE